MDGPTGEGDPVDQVVHASTANVKDQYLRVRRWLARFEDQVTKGYTPTREVGREAKKDEVYAFFIFCHHLKDWIIGSDVPKKDVVNFINSEDCLKLAADICNGIKHLNLDTPRRSANKAIFGKRRISVDFDLKTNRTIEKIRYTLSVDGKERNALRLAKECVKAWRKFLKKQNLI